MSKVSKANLKLIINGITFNCHTAYSYGSNKLWEEGTGREYKAGEFNGTLIGLFPKLEVEFAPQSALELSNLIKECEKTSQTITYYSPITMTPQTREFYSNDFSINLSRAITGDYDTFKVNFISRKRV